MPLMLQLSGSVLCLIHDTRLLCNKPDPVVAYTHQLGRDAVLSVHFDQQAPCDQYYELPLPPDLLQQVDSLHCSHGVNVQLAAALPSLRYVSCTHGAHISLCATLRSVVWCSDLLILLCQHQSSVWLNECLVRTALSVVLSDNSHLRGCSAQQNCPLVWLQDDQSTLTMPRCSPSNAKLKAHYCHSELQQLLMPAATYEGQCCACLADRATYYASPCGHAHLCDQCFARPQAHLLKRCAYCRAEITHHSRLVVVPSDQQLSLLAKQLVASLDNKLLVYCDQTK